MGVRGLVTDRLTQIIHEARTDVIYACGPMGMLRQVTTLAGRYDIPVQAAGRGVDGLRHRGLHDLRAAGRGGATGSPGWSGPAWPARCSAATQVRWDDIGTHPVRRAGRAGLEAAARAARPARGRQPRPVSCGRSSMAVDLRTRLGHVELPNPILTASGCAGAGRELAQFFDVAKIGAVVTKSVMLAPRAGRPTPRMAETPSGMLNSIGLQGPGIDAFLQRDLPVAAVARRPCGGVDRGQQRGRVRGTGRPGCPTRPG